jgi:hypothetical protein
MGVIILCATGNWYALICLEGLWSPQIPSLFFEEMALFTYLILGVSPQLSTSTILLSLHITRSCTLIND